MYDINFSIQDKITISDAFIANNQYGDFESIEDFIIHCIRENDRNYVTNIENLIYELKNKSKDKAKEEFEIT